MAKKPKTQILSRDNRVVSPITKASNVLFEDGSTAQDILNDNLEKSFTPTIENSSSMFKVGQGDTVDYSENVVNGAYVGCVLKGVTKYIDNDTGEILDVFEENRNLSLIDCKTPILTNCNLLNAEDENYKSNILSCETYFDEDTQSDKTIILRGFNGAEDGLNVETGEYIQRIGERDYQDGDSANANVITDGVKTQYLLADQIVHKVDLSGFPYAYENGHVILSSSSTESSLTPKVEYSVVTNRNGQIRTNQKMVERHQKQLDELQAMMVANLVSNQYRQTLTKVNYQLGGE